LQLEGAVILFLLRRASLHRPHHDHPQLASTI
jgi:hypothetical protein